MDLSERHPATQAVAKWFEFDHLAEPMRTVSAKCSALKDEMLYELPDSPELTIGLRKLLEAKDCLVRASLEARDQPRTLPDGAKVSRVYPVSGVQPVNKVQT